ncbi:hypothetical protein MFIFM68171_05275 [Madurella fahalii]|uniref:Uncharacterized protein n=1 Tax=Madurella fahalii TaxID=1157608 RepID=A0ABQ0GBE3_9PEZI
MARDKVGPAAPIKPDPADGEPSPRAGSRRLDRPSRSENEQAATYEPSAATIAPGRPVAIDLEADERPESPTDAVIIRRGQGGRSGTASPVDLTSSRDNSPSSVHRRAISAPDLSKNAGATPSASATQVPVPAPAPARAPAPAAPGIPAHTATAPGVAYRYYLDPSLIASAVPRLFATADELMREIDFMAPKVCKYMDRCTLTREGEEVNWRKAMSHLFGRNKNCTRSIPDNVWICLCRKHYQRARYRNNAEYNKRLCGLVECQILRLEAWSNENRRTGQTEDGIVVDWTLAVRKREQKRLDEKSSRKRPRGEDHDDDDEDLPILSSNAVPVPQWLLELCRSGYTTYEVQQIVARIGQEMQGKNPRLTQVPDIEILPNITGENAKPKNKPKTKSRSAASHRRAQSLGNALHGQVREHFALDSPNQGFLGLPARRVSQPTTFYPRDDGYRRSEGGDRTVKRARFGGFGGAHTDRDIEPRFPPRTTDRTFPDVRPMHAMARNNDERAGPSTTSYDYSAPTGPLPIPRPSYNPEATRNSYDEYRARGPHQRAFSDAGSFPWSTMPFAPSASAGYAEQTNGYAPYYPGANPGGYNTATAPPYNGRDYRHDSTAYHTTAGSTQSNPSSYYPPQSYGSQSYYQQPTHGGPPPAGAAKHMRHQSTPVGPSRSMQMMGSGPGSDLFGTTSAAAAVPATPVSSYSQTLYSQMGSGRQLYGGMQPPPATEGVNGPPAPAAPGDEYEGYPAR